MLGVVFQVVGVAGHDDRHVVLAQQGVEGGELLAVADGGEAAGVERMPEDRHLRLAARGPSAAESQARCAGSRRRATPVSTAKRANESVWNWKKGACWSCVGTPYNCLSREAVAISSSIRRSVVLVIRLSTSTRAPPALGEPR